MLEMKKYFYHIKLGEFFFFTFSIFHFFYFFHLTLFFCFLLFFPHLIRMIFFVYILCIRAYTVAHATTILTSWVLCVYVFVRVVGEWMTEKGLSASQCMPLGLRFSFKENNEKIITMWEKSMQKSWSFSSSSSSSSFPLLIQIYSMPWAKIITNPGSIMTSSDMCVLSHGKTRTACLFGTRRHT